MTFELIPLEIHIDILKYLGPDDILDYIDVSKSIRSIFVNTVKSLSAKIKEEIMNHATKYNNPRLFEFLFSNGLPIVSENLCKLAAGVNALNMIQWLYNNRETKRYIYEKFKWNPKYGFDNLKVIYETAVTNVYLNILKWLDLINYDTDINITFVALRSRNIEMLTWLWNNNKLVINDFTYLHAVKTKNKEFLIWCHQMVPYIHIGADIYISMYLDAVLSSDLDMIQCLNDNFCNWN